MVTAEDLNGEDGEVFEDSYQNNMEAIRERDLEPLTVRDLMRHRLSSRGKESEDAWWKNGFYTCDGVAYSGDRIKVVRDSDRLKEINGNSKTSSIEYQDRDVGDSVYDKLILTPDEFDEMEGIEFDRKELEEYNLSEPLCKGDVIKHPIWQALATDPSLLRDYTHEVFSKKRDEKRRMEEEDGGRSIVSKMLEPVKTLFNDEYMAVDVREDGDINTMYPCFLDNVQNGSDLGCDRSFESSEAGQNIVAREERPYPRSYFIMDVSKR